MSLQAAAQHLSNQGRGPDNTLVHMSRGEVKGLQDLAMAHGGSLSINPQTGLPEAGFLSSILPLVGGAAMSAMGMPPMMASLLMGGVTSAATGSLSKGLMAGLGAYGGAGLMGGLMGAGEGALAAEGVQAGMKGLQAGIPQFGTAGMDTAAYAQQVDALRSAQLAKAAEVPFMEKAKAGFSQIGDAPGDFFKNNWKYAAAAAPALMSAIEPTTKQPEIKTDTTPNPKYTYSPGRVDTTPNPDPYGREQTYFKPSFTRVYAGGGPIEAMSDANAVGANTGYPMADISKGAYATPYQTPISRNVLSGVSDTGVNPMTGEMAFADGGAVPADTGYTYDPLKQLFSKIESMPSDNQTQNASATPAQSGRGGINPQQAQVNSYFNSLSPEGLASHQANQAKFINAVMPGAGLISIAKSLTGQGETSNISPMAIPSLAMSKVGDAALTGIGMLANKFSKPNPNPQNVQVVDAGDMLNTPSTLADAQAKAEASNAQQAQTIAAALQGLQGIGTAGLGVGFGAPGATTGNAGAMGFGPSGMAGQTAASTTSPSAALAGLHGVGGGATGGGGGGGGVSTGSGSGGGAAAMGTGAHGMASGAANGGLMAAGGISHLGDYSDGGRLLKGPGDGVSDSIPAMIGKKQPARLADGEFVVPARIVSELGNGSTEAGARKLYAMMDRVQKARGKTVGKGKVAKNSRAEKYLPA